jgi:hypothetical protein
MSQRSPRAQPHAEIVTRALEGASGPPPAVRRVRHRRDVIFYGVGGAFWIALDIAIAITFIVDSDTSLTLWLVLLALLWFGVSCLAFARTSVVIRAEDPFFVARNMYRRHEIGWSEVSAFETGTFFGPMPGLCAVKSVVARLSDGRKVNCNALHGNPVEVAGLLDDMNSELARRQANTG